MERVRIQCPRCGQFAPVEYDPSKATSEGIYIKCKGRHCGRVFEVKVKNGRQENAPTDEAMK